MHHVFHPEVFVLREDGGDSLCISGREAPALVVANHFAPLIVWHRLYLHPLLLELACGEFFLGGFDEECVESQRQAVPGEAGCAHGKNVVARNVSSDASKDHREAHQNSRNSCRDSLSQVAAPHLQRRSGMVAIPTIASRVAVELALLLPKCMGLRPVHVHKVSPARVQHAGLDGTKQHECGPDQQHQEYGGPLQSLRPLDAEWMLGRRLLGWICMV
mmetsp:Transcript_22874/g.50392  ORF Transcript_22874/g.50392 Transcript_22874/m.50392 type:complete len:217 (+) Transcript_22874:311-961(+)